ncbi:hypothetical protein FOZ60_007441 [Perkinsus olseni]|uniref:Uncharacterized protein n=1 Tax=Perkinsus olseni TaxID=32597 RepID=A0A7J6PNQ9_PEROL|nr:hypothetical protein FOZ60_007441 [Perkinsus olseni]
MISIPSRTLNAVAILLSCCLCLTQASPDGLEAPSVDREFMTFCEFRECSEKEERSRLKPEETELMVFRRCTKDVFGKLKNGDDIKSWLGFDILDTDKGRKKLTDMTTLIRPKFSPYSTLTIIVDREVLANTERDLEKNKLDVGKKTIPRNKWHSCEWKTEVAARNKEDVWEVPVATFTINLKIADPAVGFEVSMLTAEVRYR